MTASLIERCAQADRDDDVMELALLLPIEQVAEVERLAESDGVTAGQWIRRMIQQTLLMRRTGSTSCSMLFPPPPGLLPGGGE